MKNLFGKVVPLLMAKSVDKIVHYSMGILLNTQGLLYSTVRHSLIHFLLIYVDFFFQKKTKPISNQFNVFLEIKYIFNVAHFP